MEGKNFEGRQTWKEKSKKDVEEVEDDYSDEEEASGGGGGLMLRFEENERQKKAAAAGRRGSGGGGGVGGGVSQPSCQAERCGADLVDAKRYHRRHKVCEFHSKAAVVIVSGTRQRFCQQCSRFHELIEFDEAVAGVWQDTMSDGARAQANLMEKARAGEGLVTNTKKVRLDIRSRPQETLPPSIARLDKAMHLVICSLYAPSLLSSMAL